MNMRLTEGTCYIAGLYCKNREQERNAVGVRTSIKEIEQRFIEIALNELGIEPNKILVEQKENHIHAYFYHSRVSKQLNQIISRETIIFKRRNEFSASYVAGMFDAGGHIGSDDISISGLTASDQLMLDNLGIHTKSGRIFNLGSFISFIKGRSTILKNVKITGGNRRRRSGI